MHISRCIFPRSKAHDALGQKIKNKHTQKHHVWPWIHQFNSMECWRMLTSKGSACLLLQEWYKLWTVTGKKKKRKEKNVIWYSDCNVCVSYVIISFISGHPLVRYWWISVICLLLKSKKWKWGKNCQIPNGDVLNFGSYWCWNYMKRLAKEHFLPYIHRHPEPRVTCFCVASDALWCLHHPVAHKIQTY